MEEEKTTQPDQDLPETDVKEAPADAAAESCQAQEEVVPREVLARERRGRLLVAGLAAATVATVVAVLVAGIFQFTTKWLTQCPADRTANGPATVLWKDVISDKSASQPLGVPTELVEITKLKPSVSVSQESSEGKDENQ